MRRIVACLVMGCGKVASNVDAPVADDTIDGSTDASDDAPIDAPSCITDGFDGTVLGAQWSVLAGTIPTTYEVSASRLLIADAPFATTSTPVLSFIYDLDTDKGNQIAWAQAIGGEDFTLTADLGWSSTGAEITLGGVGVSDAQGGIAGYVGAVDGNSVANGRASARLHVATGTDLTHSGPIEEPGNLTAKIERRNGVAKLYVDDVEVVTGPMPALVSNVVIFYVRHRNAAGTAFGFGSVEIRQLQLCYP